MQYTGAIFDMDGTIIDSMKIWHKIGELFFKSIQITPPNNLSDLIRGFNLSQIADYFATTLKIPYTAERTETLIRKMIADSYYNNIPEKPGARRYLERLKSKNIKMCVATATENPLARAALERLDLMRYFEFIITCPDVNAGKDEPKIYHEALNALGTDLSKTLVYEDALYAVKTASTAGFTVIGVYDEFSAHNEAEIRALCHGYIKDYSEINENPDDMFT